MNASEINQAARVLLSAHKAASAKQPRTRTPLEGYLAQMGRNRLQSVISATLTPQRADT